MTGLVLVEGVYFCKATKKVPNSWENGTFFFLYFCQSLLHKVALSFNAFVFLLLQHLLHVAVGIFHNVETGLGDGVHTHAVDGVDGDRSVD